MNQADTPETDDFYCNPPENEAAYDFARKLERERDEARELCRWAFPRLRGMCHDFDAGITGWACAEKMEEHPEIFSDLSQHNMESTN